MRTLFIRHLARRIEKLRDAFKDPPPVKGWSYATRMALGMTLKQVGSRINMSYQSVQKIENSEKDGSPSLKTMKSMAHAMECHFVYAFVPKQPLEKMIDNQAEKKAREIIKRISHSMSLEDQSLSPEDLEDQIYDLKEDLKRGNLKKIWE